jgi:hypothetical protein
VVFISNLLLKPECLRLVFQPSLRDWIVSYRGNSRFVAILA